MKHERPAAKEPFPALHNHPCAFCGRKPAEGFASVTQGGKTLWFCHGDDADPNELTCYERGQRTAREGPLSSSVDVSLDATAFGQPLVVDHLPDGFVPMDAVVVVKGLDADGGTAVFECSTTTLSTWEALGMVIACGDSLRAALRDAGQEDS